MFTTFTLIVAFSALLSYVNNKFLKLPSTIGVLILSIGVSLIMVIIKAVDISWFLQVCQIVENIDFRTILFEFLLSFLLFAGAIHVNLSNLLKEKVPVILFATIGVLTTALIVGSLLYVIVNTLGLNLAFMHCLIFGALIAPTDPVAVLSLLQTANVSKSMEAKVVGESLFNDGVGIVVFLTIITIATGIGGHTGEEVTAWLIAESFLVEAGGGLLLGLILGVIGIYFLKSIKNEPIIEVHLTLGTVMAGYSLASFIEVSGALAVVVAGLMIGNRLSKPDMPKSLKQNLNIFWKVLDEVFNAILFVLIGIEILLLGFEFQYLLLGIIAFVVVLIARLSSLLFTNVFINKKHKSSMKEVVVLTWAGLRGGISIALAFTISNELNRELILYITYVVVVLSIIAQGLTIEKLVKKLCNVPEK